MSLLTQIKIKKQLLKNIRKMQQSVFRILFLLVPTFLMAQQQVRDTLITEEIKVVKPYTPTIADAFKIKTNPSLENVKNIPKESVSYSIFSIPVASTFTPAKGKAQTIARAPKERLYNSYITAGFGNFTTPLLEAFINGGDSRYSNFGIFVKHLSSEGGIDNVLLNDNFADTKIDAFYKQYDRDFNWQINTGVNRKLYNYYGLPTTVVYDENVLNAIDEKQVYKKIYAGGLVQFEDSFFEGGSVELVNFSDNFSNNEFHFLAKPKVSFPLSTEKINAEFILDVISGKFKSDYNNTAQLKHSFFTAGFNPNFEIIRDNLSINLGAKLFYSNNLEEKESNFFAYPNVTASFNLIQDIFILVAGVTGDLIQNSYDKFSEKNPYISPTLTVLQTDKQYNAFAGAKGKLASNISYNLTANYSNEINKPLYKLNQSKTDGSIVVTNGFEAGNSFNVVYDDVKTFSLNGELEIEASKEFNFTASASISKFTLTNEAEAWNLPDTELTIGANYSKNNWYASAKLFYVGETKDWLIPYGFAHDSGGTVTNDSYLDLNFNGGYIFSDRLTAFARLNNALGKKYQPFYNYNVQTLQIMGGITYKFDL